MTPYPCDGNVPDMPERDTISVWVTSVSYLGGPVAHGKGETEDGEAIEFAGEPRALCAVSEALDAGDGPILVPIPTWWSLSWRQPRSTTPARSAHQRTTSPAGPA
jgi:hypothetical protein